MAKHSLVKKQLDEKGWQECFRTSSLKVGFILTLTKSQLEFICAVADDVSWDRSLFTSIHMPDNWVSVETALTRRGLIVRKKDHPDYHKEYRDGTREWGAWHYCELTPAGEHVVELLKLAGIFQAAELAIRKKSKRA